MSPVRSRPRILINALSLGQGGGRSYVTNLVRELGRDDRGFAFTLLLQPDQTDVIEGQPIAVREIRLPKRMRALWRIGYEQLVMPLLAARFDLVYCIADVAPRFCASPIVVLLRNLNIYDRRWYDDRRTRTLERLVRWGLPNAQRILFPSQAAADIIGEHIAIPRDRVRVVHYGVSVEAFDAVGNPERPAIRYLFLPAAVERHKNIEVLIDGLARAADRELELWIAGSSLSDPGHREVLQRLADARGVGSRLRFLGSVSYRNLLHYYRGAVALAFPSFIETFGHPLVEAMAAGTPLLISDIPAFREIAAEAGSYFSPGDPGAVARAIDGLLADPEAARRRVQIGLERAARFSWRASIDALCSVFGEVVGRSG